MHAPDRIDEEHAGGSRKIVEEYDLLPYLPLSQKPASADPWQQTALEGRRHQLPVEFDDEVRDSGFCELLTIVEKEHVGRAWPQGQCPLIHTSMRGLVVEEPIARINRLGRHLHVAES